MNPTRHPPIQLDAKPSALAAFRLVCFFFASVPSTSRQPIDFPCKLLYSNVSVVVIADANAVITDMGLRMRKLIFVQHLATSDFPIDRMV